MQKYLLVFVILTGISINSVFALEETKTNILEFFGTIATIITMGTAAIPIGAFFLTLHYQRKNVTANAMYILSFTIESTGFEVSRKKLYSRYFEGKEVSREDLDIAAESVIINLTILEGLIEGIIKREIIFGLYVDIIVKSIDAYQKYLDETQPQYPLLSQPLRKLYELAQKYLAEGKSFKAVNE